MAIGNYTMTPLDLGNFSNYKIFKKQLDTWEPTMPVPQARRGQLSPPCFRMIVY